MSSDRMNEGFDYKAAHRASMTRENLLAEVARRLADGRLTLPEKDPDRHEALKAAVLRIMYERYVEELPKA